MPIYTYKCKLCEALVEEVTPITKHKTLRRCPECKEPTLERTYEGYGGFSLKGRDWPSQEIKRRGGNG